MRATSREPTAPLRWRSRRDAGKQPARSAAEPDIDMDELRASGGAASEEDLLLLALFGDDAEPAAGNAARPRRA